MPAKRWEHQCSQAWLDARKGYLTASEVVSLLPEYKRIKAGKVDRLIAPMFVKMWGQKNSTEPDDPMSYGAAARGHILEPHAIDDWNRLTRRDKLCWWDDAVVHNGIMGFSPDALDIEQPGEPVDFDYTELKDPKVIGEVKSYDPGKHAQKIVQHTDEHEERWQLAMGMLVLPSVEEARLIFYCPPLGSMFTEYYAREDLESEMQIIEDIVGIYLEVGDHMGVFKDQEQLTTEDEIYREYLLAQQSTMLDID